MAKNCDRLYVKVRIFIFIFWVGGNRWIQLVGCTKNMIL
jgi:hypothetical protein